MTAQGSGGKGGNKQQAGGRGSHGHVSFQSEQARWRTTQPARILARRVGSAQRAAQRRQQARRDSFR